MKAKKIEKEAQAAIDWLGSRPGVVSVIISKRATSVRHRHKPGFSRVAKQEPHGVYVQVYGSSMFYETFVNSSVSPLRDSWVALLAGGAVVGDGNEPTKKYIPTPTQKVAGVHDFPSEVPAPKAIDAEAGQTFDVTPELAAKWLERNTRNRVLRMPVVIRYANDMRAGRWMVTGDAIAFDKNGAIINGQHRLWAVFESGMTVRMLVCFDLEPEVVRVLDDHLKRKLTDIMLVAHPGINVQNIHAAAARNMMFALSRTDRHSAASRVSRQEQMAFLEKHLPAIEFSYRECFKSGHKVGIAKAGIVAFVARASYTQDKERLMAFGKVLITGMPADAGDHAAVVFRNWLMRLDRLKMKASPETIYRKGERALDAFLKSEHMKTLYEAPEELFLLPEEKAEKLPKRSTRGLNSKRTVEV